MARAVSTEDAAREEIRTPHPGTVLVVLLVMLVMLLGLYEAFATLVDPQAGVVLPLLGFLGS